MGLSDPSVLLATAVQSGAALVGIVGGLLGSRYVALDAEQQAARRTLEAARLLLGPAREERDRAEAGWIEFHVADCMDTSAVYDEISKVPPGGELDLDEVLAGADVDEQGIPREALRARMELIDAEMRRAIRDLDERVAEIEDHESWTNFRRVHRLDPGHDDVWEWVYDVITEERAKKAKQARKEAERRARERSPLGSLYTPVDFDIPRFNRAIRPIDTGNSGWRTATIGRLATDREETQRRVVRLEAEEKAAEQHVSITRQPEGFTLAIWVLAFLSITTMAYPTALMAWGPKRPGPCTLTVVAVLFMLGVGLLMRYLFVYASVLSTHAARRRMPRTPIGLLVPYSWTKGGRGDRLTSANPPGPGAN
ncbi:MAG: hypothetical protein ACJ72L_11670 [Marmoricola sp.]